MAQVQPGLQIIERFGNFTAANTASVTITITSTTNRRTELHLFYRSGGTKFLSSVSDSQSNTWVVDASNKTNGTGQYIGHARATMNAPLTGGSDTVTLTWNTNTSAASSIWLQEVSGVYAVASDASNTAGVTTSASPSIATGALASPQELVWGLFYNGASSAWTPGQTAVTTSSISTGTTVLGLEYKVVTSASTSNMTGSWGGSVAWIAATWTYELNTSGVIPVM